MPPKKTGKPLVIVESPAKAKTIGKFLGAGYLIEASIGHVRDLPGSADEIPAALKKEKWARLGIDVENDFKPLYVVPKAKREQMRKLKALLKEASLLYLATDEDREGESISWHLLQELAPKVPGQAPRLPRDHEERDRRRARVAARHRHRARRGAGDAPHRRPALRLRRVAAALAQDPAQAVGRARAERGGAPRRRARARAHPVPRRRRTGTSRPTFATPKGEGIVARLVEWKGRRVATGKDFEPDTGELRKPPGGRARAAGPPPRSPTRAALVARLTGRQARVAELEQKPFTERPAPPFTTSTLQQEASKKLRFAAAAHDARRPAPLRERLHHVHAHRLDHALGRGASAPRAA